MKTYQAMGGRWKAARARALVGATGRRGWRGLVIVAAAAAASVSFAPAASGQVADTQAVDVLFVFDTTGSMGGALSEAKSQVFDAVGSIRASLPDSQFAVAAVADYPPDVPWRLMQAMTADAEAVSAAISPLFASGGGDGPEAYGRALFEAVHNPEIGWREGSRRLLVLVNDNVPHDTDLNEGVPDDIRTVGSPFNTGIDAGRDAIARTEDDIDWQAALGEVAASGITFANVFYSGSSTYLPYWNWWTGLTGGSTTIADGTISLGDVIVDLVEGTVSGGNAEIAGLGDSIAAGHGVGASTWDPDKPSASPPNNADSYPQLLARQRGTRAVNFAISGACIGRRGDSVASGSPFAISATTADGCPEDNVNDQVRRLVESGQTPEIVTVTVGGNDIRFGDCFRATLSITGFQSSSGSDPCSGTTFVDNLSAYESNLTNLYRFLRATYPDATIVQTRQYLPLPIVSPTPACRVFYLGYLATNPSGYATHLKSGDLDEAVADYADTLGAKQVRVVSSLNRIINRVAAQNGVRIADTTAFAGHDLCGQYEEYEPYVLAPRGNAVLRLSRGSGGVSNTFSLTTKDSYSNGSSNPCSDDPCIYITSPLVLWQGHGVTLTLTSAEVEANGVPHPNRAGQAALAVAVAAAL